MARCVLPYAPLLLLVLLGFAVRVLVGGSASAGAAAGGAAADSSCARSFDAAELVDDVILMYAELVEELTRAAVM